MTTSPFKPNDCPWLMPHLTVADVDASASWYEKAFGMMIRLRLPQDGQPAIHVELVWHDMVIMLGKSGAPGCPAQVPAVSGVTSPTSLYLYCEDVDAIYQDALAAGAKSQAKPMQMFWGDRICTITDPDGHAWTFATKTSEPDSPKSTDEPEAKAEREHRSVTLQTMPDLRVIYDRQLGPYTPKKLEPFFKSFANMVQTLGLKTPQSMLIGICQDDPRAVADENCRYDAAVTVEDDIPCPDGLKEQIIPGGDYAVILHKGSYEQLAATWQWIGEVAFTSLGRECRDQAPFENYLNSPEDVFEDELLTEIWIPLY